MNTEERDQIARIFEETIKRVETRYREEITALRTEVSRLRNIAVAKAERGPAGRDGKDGASVSMSEVEGMVERYVAALPLRHGTNGKDGKSVTVDDVMPLIEAAIEREVAKIPAPVDGKPGRNGKDGDSVTLADVTPMIESAVRRHVAAIPVPQDGKDGRNGVDGKDGVSAAEITPLIESTVRRHIAAIPLPRDGKDGHDGTDGKDGTSVTLSDVTPLIESTVAKHVSRIPVPQDGKNGRDGASVTLEDVAPLVKSALASEVAKIPAATNGKDGRDGKDGESVDVGEVVDQLRSEMQQLIQKGLARITPPIEDLVPLIQRAAVAEVAKLPAPKGRDGVDGTSVTVAEVQPLIERLVAREAAKMPIPRDGRDGKDGEHGRDAAQIQILTVVDETRTYPRGSFAHLRGGLFQSDGQEWKCIVDGIADVDTEEIDDRHFAIVHRMSSGKIVRKVLHHDAMIYHDVWKPEQEYVRGDTATWDGSMWVARKTTKLKPGDSNDDWRLAVKRGRNGKL